MIKNAIDSRIPERIGAFVQELDQLVRKSALEALEGVLSGKAAAPALRSRPGPKPVRSSPASSGDVAEKVLAHVQANDGQSVSQIGAALGASSKDLRKAMLTLQKEGKIHTSGQRRGTRYHAGAGKKRARARRKA